MDVRGKNAVVTGGGTGIGLAIACALKEAGANVTICGRRKEKLEEAAAAHGFTIATLDITDDRSVKALAKRKDIDLLVNNAGLMHVIDVHDAKAVEVAEKEFSTNVLGVIRVTHALLPTLEARDGAVVNVSSGLAYVPWPAAPSYCATKAAVHSWTKSLRSQVKIEVFEVLPPLTDTAMVADVDIGMAKVSPEDVAKALVRGVRKGKKEIPVGMSKALRSMSRIAPGFIDNQLAAKA